MIGDQKQEATGDSIAIQSRRDTIIHQGISPADMRIILDSLAEQQRAYAEVALQMVDVRLRDFKEHVLEKFTDEKATRSSAFKDPDFQYLIGRAQHAYARSGDPNIRDTLVDLIAERSKQTDRNRLALSLNEAVEKAALLTKNEFAELSLCFVLRYTINHAVHNKAQLAHYLNTTVMPFVKDISTEESSFAYLEAQACANVSVLEADLLAALRQKYGGVTGKGFTREQLESHLPEGKKKSLDSFMIPCLNDPTKLQPNAVTQEIFVSIAAPAGLDKGQLDNVWALFQGTMWSEKEFITEMQAMAPEIGALFRVWKDTPLKNLSLTSVGIAIGYANLVRVAPFDADLSIWIK